MTLPDPDEIHRLLARPAWRLGFRGRLEKDYRQHLLAEWQRPATLAVALGALLFAAYGILDKLAFPAYAPVLWRIRFGVVLPLVLACLLVLPRLRTESAFQRILLAMILIVGFGITAFNMVMHTHYYQGLVLVLLFGCVVLPMRFPYALISAIVLLAAYVAIRPALDPHELASFVGMFDTTTAALFGLLANFLLDRYRRRDYLRSRLLERLSRQDGLTGVATRKAFDDNLASVWAQAGQAARPVALLFLDLDHFKALNDRAGHQVGDECLRRIAEVLRRHTRREGDCVGRYGGEEFTLLLPGVSEAEARQVAERIREEVARLDLTSLLPESVPHGVTASIGVLWVARPGELPWAEALKRADAAMYRAKQAGRNRVEVETDGQVPQ